MVYPRESRFNHVISILSTGVPICPRRIKVYPRNSAFIHETQGYPRSPALNHEDSSLSTGISI